MEVRGKLGSQFSPPTMQLHLKIELSHLSIRLNDKNINSGVTLTAPYFSFFFQCSRCIAHRDSLFYEQ